MLSFAEFLKESKVDPEKFANRIGRMRGKNGHIPIKTPDFEEHEAEIEDAAKTKTPKISRQRFRIKDLKPTNLVMRVDDKKKLRDKIANKNPDHIKVITHGGKHYIDDGHHAVMAARLRGETHVDAEHHDYD